MIPPRFADFQILQAVDKALLDVTSAKVEINMRVYRHFLGQPLRTTDNAIGLVSVRRLRAERKKFLAAAVARKLGGR